MKQKYVIVRDNAKELKIREYAELDKDLLSLLCEETYLWEAVEAALAKGTEALVYKLRTPNLYPSYIYAVKIAEAVTAMAGSESTEPVELIFDDLDYISKDQHVSSIAEVIEEESAVIDDLLEEDFDEEFEEKENLNIDEPLKVADDEMIDIDDEG
jgi:hypothetical protein